MTKDELLRKLKDGKEELFNLRFQQATNQLSNPMRIPEVKRDIARIKTIIKESEIKERIAK